MSKKVKWLKQYFKKCHLAKSLNPLAPFLAIVLVILGFAIANSKTSILIIWSQLSYLGSIILAIYSLQFCYRYGNYELVQVIDWSMIGLDMVLLILALTNFLSWRLNNINDLVIVLLLISTANNLLGDHYKKKRDLY